MSRSYLCLMCRERHVSIRMPLCSTCYKKYPKEKWEEWFKELWREEKRERYRDGKIQKHEISFSDCSYTDLKDVGLTE